MPEKVFELQEVGGLTLQQTILLRRQFGLNIIRAAPYGKFIRILWSIITEPMFLMLVAACSIYFILGEFNEGFLMLAAMIIITAISFYQDIKSNRALQALRELAAPKVIVVRDSRESLITQAELVPGDIIILEEGMRVPADAIILEAHDCSTNESVITGESLPVDKNDRNGRNLLYQGSTLNSGKCLARVTATGNKTEFGKIGNLVAGTRPPKTQLQLTINKLVIKLSAFGLAGFCVILIMNYSRSHQLIASILCALTLAMSAVPEEIPVAFTSFMALGAYRLSKMGIISRQPGVIENLGVVNVICFDKTGTLTENKMELKFVYEFTTDSVLDIESKRGFFTNELLDTAILASETDPFDPMEQAILSAGMQHKQAQKYKGFKRIYEYPLEGHPPMMTHVYLSENLVTAAAKGAPERILDCCHLNDKDRKAILRHIAAFTADGYRVLGVAAAIHTGPDFPPQQDNFDWDFKGLIALYDPIKKNIPVIIKQLQEAQINVKLLTGDFPETAKHIARQAGMINYKQFLTGNQVMEMDGDKLTQLSAHVNVFARMFPAAKLKLINILKANKLVVAMTGDGVNDAPALKSADIGIAMGGKGTEMAKEAAGIIITDDNLEKLVIAVAEGRKIFSNFKKAIRYIISIHIPIILTAALPVLLGWRYPNIFTPVHIIFMELIMGPTCSIFFEKEPAEENIMQFAPRSRSAGLFTGRELLMSIAQGSIIALSILLLYFYYMHTGASLATIGTIVFTTLIMANILLTFTSRSFTTSIVYTVQYKNRLAPVILFISITFLLSILVVPAIRGLFQLAAITALQFLICFLAALISTLAFELYKAIAPVRVSG